MYKAGQIVTCRSFGGKYKISVGYTVKSGDREEYVYGLESIGFEDSPSELIPHDYLKLCNPVSNLDLPFRFTVYRNFVSADSVGVLSNYVGYSAANEIVNADKNSESFIKRVGLTYELDKDLKATFKEVHFLGAEDVQ